MEYAEEVSSQDEVQNGTVSSFNDLFGISTKAKRRERVKPFKPQDFPDFHGILYHSDIMEEQINKIKKVAPSEDRLLVTGETGTGKELIAKAVHEIYSEGNKERPFIAVNCAAIPENLLESELFGVIPGYPGFQSKEGLKGKLVAANGGTLFLDEINSMSIQMQAKLLRFFTDGKVFPLGSTEGTDVKTRVISASNIDLQKPEVRIEEGFKDDLYYRIAESHVHLPNLSSRGIDSLIIFTEFLNDLCKEKGIVNNFKIRLIRIIDILLYDWPGNAREVMNYCRYIVSNEDSEIDLHNVNLFSSKNPNHLHVRLQNLGFKYRYIARFLLDSGDYINISDLIAHLKRSQHLLHGHLMNQIEIIVMQFTKYEDSNKDLSNHLKVEYGVDKKLSEFVSELESKVISRRMEQLKENKSKVAESLGITRPTLDKRLS